MKEIKNIGIQNEYKFVEIFNGKHLKELDYNSQIFIQKLFNGNINNDEIIKSWKNKYLQKADIFIKYKNVIRSVSIKCGYNNSVHQETIEDFKRYLEKIGLSYKIINYYLSFHYGYMRKENGEIDYSQSLSEEEYKKLFQNEIDIFNNSINKTRIIIDMIDRFIIRGKNAEYDIDALIYGTPDDYIWILKYDLYDLILKNKCPNFTSPHIACLTIRPKNRNLKRKAIYAKERYYISVRWNHIKEMITEFINDI